MTATTLTLTNTITMPLRTWTTQNLEDTFQLNRKLHCAILEDWLAMPFQVEEEVERQLEVLRIELMYNAETWNEAELKWFFISNLVNLVNFKTKNYNLFLERQIEATINKITLKGFVDAMVAQGRYEPKTPYFCFHEYKKEKGSSDDPRGQLLSAMLVAQQLNNNSQPVYGAYVIGRNWFFVILDGNDYCVSNNYSATHKDELKSIFGILSNLKVIIQKQLQSNTLL